MALSENGFSKADLYPLRKRLRTEGISLISTTGSHQPSRFLVMFRPLAQVENEVTNALKEVLSDGQYGALQKTGTPMKVGELLTCRFWTFLQPYQLYLLMEKLGQQKI